ncbi:MAG: M67 family metallopeptidase [Gammaproteobacteria bacterium]|nr:M67 family metallopeptidase [Gammaproteobacteria bacterium]MCI0591236.1 M67 family metallopeptidase [Gammaproteobacteria bacterium]
MKVKLPRALAKQMLDHAQGAAEVEVCGLLGGRGKQITSVYPVPNAADDPTRFFLMEPRAQIDAMRAMRNVGETLFGIYHSHPSAPAHPSRHDLEQTAYPGVLYVIISLANAKPTMEGYYLEGGTYKMVTIIG